MLENFVISGETIAICVACIAIGYMGLKLYLRVDTASEKRHKTYIDMSNIAKEAGYEVFSEFMKCAAVDDFDGMYEAAQNGKAILLDEELRSKHFEPIFKKSLQNPNYNQLIIGRADELKKLEVSYSSVSGS